MNSRERVRIVLDHKIPDRIPIDLGSMRSSGISTITYNNLKKKLNIKSKQNSRMYDFIQQLAFPDEQIMKKFNIDAIDAGQGFLRSVKDWKEWILNDGSKCLVPKLLKIETDDNGTVYLLHKDGSRLGKKPVSSLYVDQCYWVWGELPSIPDRFENNEFSKHLWAVPSPPWHLDIFDKEQFGEFVSGIRELY